MCCIGRHDGRPSNNLRRARRSLGTWQMGRTQVLQGPGNHRHNWRGETLDNQKRKVETKRGLDRKVIALALLTNGGNRQQRTSQSPKQPNSLSLKFSSLVDSARPVVPFPTAFIRTNQTPFGTARLDYCAEKTFPAPLNLFLGCYRVGSTSSPSFPWVLLPTQLANYTKSCIASCTPALPTAFFHGAGAHVVLPCRSCLFQLLAR
ncbi:hypothetical protein B0T13DRAFT_38516 [Neurospora crassa]|nr:hypothetical protein B0T13DRAFT_38516 [Neurospora crassa]